MAACSCCVSLEKVEEDITASGMELMNPPPSMDELLKLLQKVESLLRMVGQYPSGSMISALQPVRKALVRNELLTHTDEDVKVSVVSCITEISRIFVPKYPYDDHKLMEEILQQTLMVLKKLSDVTGRSYRKVVRILEIFAKVRVCVVLLELENESLIIEIFKIFLEAIRPYHPHNIFTWMKEIMTRLIDESDELSVELLRPLLDILKIDNQMDSPVASILGEKVLKDCAAIVKPYFAEALKSMSLNSDDYAAIVALLCNEMPKGKEMDDTHWEKLKDTCTTNIMKLDNPEDVQPSTNVPKENQEGTGSHKLTSHPVKVGPSEAKFCEQVLQDDTHRENLKDTCTTNIMKLDNPEDVQPAKNVPKENQEGTGTHKLIGHPVKVGPAEAKFCEPVLQDDTHRETLKDTCTTNIMKPDNLEDMQPATNVPKGNQEGTGSHKLEDMQPATNVPKGNQEGTGNHKLEDMQPATNVPKGNQEGTGSHKLTGHSVKVGPSEAKFCEQVLQDDTHRENLKDTCTTNIMKLDNPEDVQPAKHVPKENQEGTGTHKLIGHPVKVGPAEAKFCEPVLQDDTHRETLKDTCTANIMKPDNLEDMQPATNVPKGNQEGTGSHKLEDMQPATNVPKGNQEGAGNHKLEDMQPATNVPKGNQEGTGSHKLTGHSVKVGPSEAKFCEPVVQDDTHREKLKDTCTTNIMKPDNPEDVQPTTNVPKESQEGTGSHKLTGSSGHHSLVSEHNNNCTGTHGHWRQPKKNEIRINENAELVVLLPIGDVPQSQVQKKDSLHLGLTWGERTKRTLCAKRGRDSRKNESASDDDAERKSESSIINEEGNIKEHREPSLQQVLGMKQTKKKKTTTKMDDTEESGDKATKSSVKDENHLNKCANYKSRRKLATRKHEESKRARTSKDHGAELIGAKIKVWWPLEQVFYEGFISSFDSEANTHEVIYDDGEVEKLRLHKEQWELLEDDSSQKDSKRPCTIKDYGKELVGTRIKVWWPLDEKFYEGVVSSFNPMKRKHKVVYDDGEVEKLRLHKERWEMLEDNSSQKVQSLQDHGLDFQGHAVSSATSSEKKAKRHSSTGPNISSSKRS